MPKKSQKTKRKPIFTPWGNPVLHRPAKPVPRNEIGKPGFKKLVRKMFRLIRGVGGVGLAANQIGLSMKFAVLEVRLTRRLKGLKPVPPTVIINPKIISYSKNKIGFWEGCLSCVEIRVWVERSASIKVTYINENNKRITRIINGWEARVFQHEIDHLNGKVCGERVITKNGKVVSGSIISTSWHKEHPQAKLKNK